MAWHSVVGAVHFTVQDCLELVGKGVVAGDQALTAGREAVVGDDRRNCREQADCRSDQRFGNARRHGSQGGLLHLGEAKEGVHDAPYGAEQTDVGTGRAYRGKERQRWLKFFLFAGNGHAHRTVDTIHDRIGVYAGLLAQAGTLLEAGTKNLLDPRVWIRVATRLAIQLGQIDTRPETLFEGLQTTLGSAHQVAALKDDDPRSDRGSDQRQHNQLHDQAGVTDQ